MNYAIAMLFFLLGCSFKPNDKVLDQCKREALFKQCMAHIPPGPSHVVSNDWDEVVDSCETSALYQSIRERWATEPKCRVEWP